MSCGSSLCGHDVSVNGGKLLRMEATIESRNEPVAGGSVLRQRKY